MKYDYTVFVGRFQPFHIGHETACKQAAQISKHLIILVGSAFSSPTIRNPFTFEQRRDLIAKNLNAWGNHNFTILPIRDYHYSDDAWCAEVQRLVGSVAGDNKNIALLGYKKDSTSYYLDLFPQWEEEVIVSDFETNATDIRNYYFKEQTSDQEICLDSDSRTSQVTKQFLKDYTSDSNFTRLQEEYNTIAQYKVERPTKYPVIDVTTDAVVTCGGHVLLITRGGHPGKGLYALPGGFLSPEERALDGCLRELKEETKIKVPKPVLKGSLVADRYFDHPLRSVRGRSITFGFHFKLNDKVLPKVKGGDDAVKAEWVELNWIFKNSDKMFEDHLNIIEAFLGKI